MNNHQISQNIIDLGQIVLPYTAPLFQPSIKTRFPEVIGSCVLLRKNDTHMASTAAHVIDENSQSSFYFNPENNPIDQAKIFSSSIPKNGNRSDDQYDIAIMVLNNTDIQYFQENKFKFLDIRSITNEDASSYLALGYPSTKTKASLQKMSINRNPYSILAMRNDISDLKNKKFNDDIHISIDFNSKKTLVNGVKNIPPNLGGASGGGLWRLKYDHEGNLNLHLAGTLTDAYPSKKATRFIVSTKVKWMLNLINQSIP